MSKQKGTPLGATELESPAYRLGAVRDALKAGARAACCGDAACHYEDSGLPCALVEQAARDAAIIAAFLRALPDRFPMERPGGVTWGHAKGEMARLARLVEEAANGRHP